ncbi:MAG: TonB-dependent receptor plug domain-containing protein, partial [Nitrospinaceae bacterium]|nr:TonB-dependent receptor plug domain-containing protein [Nitrospinaceae bacterium]
SEVMETVPGVHVSRKAGGYNPIFVFRGIYSEFNPQVLVLIDGVPLT